MKIIKQKNGLQLRKLGSKQAKEQGCDYGIYSKDFGDYEAYVGSVKEGLEWLYPEYHMNMTEDEAEAFFGSEEAFRLGLVEFIEVSKAEAEAYFASLPKEEV